MRLEIEVGHPARNDLESRPDFVYLLNEPIPGAGLRSRGQDLGITSSRSVPLCTWHQLNCDNSLNEFLPHGVSSFIFTESLILAQDERWRRA